jgi:hypothetical protein
MLASLNWHSKREVFLSLSLSAIVGVGKCLYIFKSSLQKLLLIEVPCLHTATICKAVKRDVCPLFLGMNITVIFTKLSAQTGFIFCTNIAAMLKQHLSSVFIILPVNTINNKNGIQGLWTNPE